MLFQSGYTISHSYQRYTRDPVFLCPHQYKSFFFFFFSNSHILIQVRRHLIVIMIYISLMISDVERSSYNSWPFACLLWRILFKSLGFFGGSVVKNLRTNTGDAGSVLGSWRSSGEGNGNLLQCSLGNPMDRGALWATVHRVSKSQTRLSNYTTITTIRLSLQFHVHVENWVNMLS